LSAGTFISVPNGQAITSITLSSGSVVMYNV